ncbi:SMI1/KNR4 family protein [Actinomadura sp. 6N118]|uniref:SMI1/KNR4 family protein n=1 Tax=Actinomadura sp. 6N118 TaxID=3375151 RepID=UPI0037AFF260
MARLVEDSWDRIVVWLRRHAPASAAELGPPATDDDLAIVEALLGRTPPADLRAWWRRSCGTSGSHRLLLMPRYTPYTIDEAVDSREVMLEVASAFSNDDTSLIAEPAGSPCTLWLPVWLPIADDGGGSYLFADLRQGPLHGCIMKWDKYEGAVGKPLWQGIAEMLAGIADALEHGMDVQGDRPEVCDDDTLDWV